jgi:hypothetical protein
MPASGSIALRSILSLLVILFFSLIITPVENAEACVNGDGTRENPYVVPMTTRPVAIDGDIGEEEWAGALVLELNYEIQPGENIAASVRTQMLLSYDSGKLYAAFRCYDPEPAAIRAHLADRDTIFGEDHVNIQVDTFDDERRCFFYGGNPFGVQMDGLAINGSFGSSLDAIWDSAARVYEWGWAFEMAVPFNQLRFQRSDGPQVWGFNAWRFYPRSQQQIFALVPNDRNNNCYQCEFVKIEGFEDATPGHNIEIDPTLTAARTDARPDFPEGGFEKQSQEAEVGLTARWGVTPNMMLGLTANPDFSQVEADALQLDINEPFELFFSEKRPFFMEGADFFQTRLNVVYTRMMRDPSWGMKLTGKESGNTIGAYVVRDEITNLVFPGSQGSDATSLDAANTSSVFRYKRDIGSRYTVGLLGTDREGGEYYNRVFGFDSDFRFTDRDIVRVQVLGSATRYPGAVAEEFGQDSESFGGRAVYATYSHNTRSNDWSLSYREFSEGFRADLGYIPRVNYRLYSAGYNHTWWGKEGSWWSSFDLGGGYDHYEEMDGDPLERDLSFFLEYSGAMQTWLYVTGGRNIEAYNSQEFPQNYLSINLEMVPSGDVGLALYARLGDKIDYANTRLGKRTNLEPWLRFNFGKHLKLSLDHTFERLDVDAGRLYDANVSQFTAIYQFNTRAFFRSILQYVDYRYHPELYIDAIDSKYQHLFAQLLFSYKINPQTVLFIGYSDNCYGDGGYGLVRSDRTLFVKLGYAWVL